MGAENSTTGEGTFVQFVPIQGLVLKGDGTLLSYINWHFTYEYELKFLWYELMRFSEI